MSSLKSNRKELWDYLQEQGIILTSEQHQTVKGYITRYCETRCKILSTELTHLIQKQERLKESQRRHAEKKKRYRENRLARKALLPV